MCNAQNNHEALLQCISEPLQDQTKACSNHLKASINVAHKTNPYSCPSYVLELQAVNTNISGTRNTFVFFGSVHGGVIPTFGYLRPPSLQHTILTLAAVSDMCKNKEIHIFLMYMYIDTYIRYIHVHFQAFQDQQNMSHILDKLSHARFDATAKQL